MPRPARRMSDQQLHEEILGMLQQGHDTVGESLAWTWYLLSLHPEVERKLHLEIAEVVGDRVPVVADLPRLPYAHMDPAGVAAGVSPGLGHPARRDQGRRDWRLSHPGRIDDPAQPVPHPPPSRLLGESRGVRPRALSAGAIARSAPSCVFSVRRRAAAVHGRGHGHDGDDADHGDGRAAAPHSPGVGPSRGARVHPRHDPALPRAGDASAATGRHRSAAARPCAGIRQSTTERHRAT